MVEVEVVEGIITMEEEVEQEEEEGVEITAIRGNRVIKESRAGESLRSLKQRQSLSQLQRT